MKDNSLSYAEESPLLFISTIILEGFFSIDFISMKYYTLPNLIRIQTVEAEITAVMPLQRIRVAESRV